MSKKRFIQAVVVRTLPALDKLAATVDYAETVWDGLTVRGYGADQPTKSRESKDWLAELTAQQRKDFLRFWAAFAYKTGRNQAAKRWGELCQSGKINADTVNEVIEAAAKEAARLLPAGQSRKMAEGWLNDQRWQDFAKAPVDNSQRQRVEHNRLVNELAALESLYQASKAESLAVQIEQIKAKLKAMQSASRGQNAI